MMDDDDIDAMYERDMDMRWQQSLVEAWQNNPKRPEIELRMAEEERYFNSIRGQIFYWRTVEGVSWWKMFRRVTTSAFTKGFWKL